MKAAKISMHNGKWDLDYDAIDVLSSIDQYLPRSSWGSADTHKLGIRAQHSMLGLDTEMLIKLDGKMLWPHELGLPQERIPKGQETSGGACAFDWHGDGFATELCIQPAHCLEYILAYVSGALWWFDNKRPNHTKTDIKNGSPFTHHHQLEAPAVYELPEAVVLKAPDAVKRLGCMPSMSVYNDPGTPGGLGGTKRTTGCHLHISHPVLASSETCLSLIKWADILVGCTWVYISPENPAQERERRKAYGRAGEYRLKVYPVYPETQTASGYKNGVEYRVLPGTVMQHPAYLSLMLSLYRSAMRLAALYGDPKESVSILAKDAINESDKDLAKSVISSLPFKENGRRLLDKLYRSPLKVNTLGEWADIGRDAKGHQFLEGTNIWTHVRMEQVVPGCG